MRHVQAIANGFQNRRVARIAELSSVGSEWDPELQFIAKIETQSELEQFQRLKDSGVTNIGLLTRDPRLYHNASGTKVLEKGELLQPGDVVALADSLSYAHVLYRESDTHHTVFLTNRCNSYCLMCSQPPTAKDDSWLIEEALSVSKHIRFSPKILGFTGGEPLLLGAQLRHVLDDFSQRHPNTEFDLLTNGRLLSDTSLAASLLKESKNPVSWMVPLYGHADFLHDFVVQSPGAFDQTIDGLLTLRRYGQPIQIRIVLIKPVLEVLPELCNFIGRNLPFVREVALMGCEPIGFALANREFSEVDLLDWAHQLEAGIRSLKRARLTPMIMNIPLCALPQSIWPYAHQSISDWKRTFASECINCSMKEQCSGLFAWYEKGWRPTTIKAF